LNNLRQIGIAATNLEAATGRLPHIFFEKGPGQPNYGSDRGPFVMLLNYIDETNRADQFDKKYSTFAVQHAEPILTTPVVFRCPTSSQTTLTNLSDRFGGADVGGHNSMTCDYACNTGYVAHIDNGIPFRRFPGPVQFDILGISKSYSTRNVTDGASNTLLCFESSFGEIRYTNGLVGDVNLNGIGKFKLKVNDSHIYESAGIGSSKAYLYSWAGLRAGSIVVYDSAGGIGSIKSGSLFFRTINVENSDGSNVFSLHPQICGVVRVDGSTEMLSENIDPLVMVSLATAHNSD
jgi:hypothetical protein